jgi:hypothetical protein
MAFGQDFLKSFFGNDYLKDYTHASKTFRSNGYENSPRLKFLFHVYFNLNTTAIPALANAFSAGDQSTIGILVKNIELPKYQLEVDVMNQYNRKRLIQKKINYQPVRCSFHDDAGDLIRTLWYNYFAYYYKDPTQTYRGQNSQAGTSGPSAIRTTGFDYNARDTYDGSRFVNDWGYIGEAYSDGTNSPGGKPAFFKDISIYGFNQHSFVEYVLINPLITDWSHDTYDYSQGDGIMENSMTIQYETVKYYSGAIGGVRPSTNVQGFGDPNYYDTIKSPLSRPGGTQSILGQGGLLDAGLGIYQDLQALASGRGGLSNVIGAVQKAGTAYQTFRGKNVQAIAREEAKQGLRDVLRSTIPAAIRAQPNANTTVPGSAPVQQRLTAPLFLKPPGP